MKKDAFFGSATLSSFILLVALFIFFCVPLDAREVLPFIVAEWIFLCFLLYVFCPRVRAQGILATALIFFLAHLVALITVQGNQGAITQLMVARTILLPEWAGACCHLSTRCCGVG